MSGNVLITSAGRRNYLVGYFQAALRGAGKVIAVDANSHAPALVEADVSVVVPSFHAPDYVPVLLELVRTHDARLLVCVHDEDARVLARHREQFRRAGCLALLPDAAVVELVSDKLRLADFCAAAGIGYPTTFAGPDQAVAAVRAGAARLPMVVKARFGSASQGLAFVDTVADLEAAGLAAQSMLQRTVPGDDDPARFDVLVQERAVGDEFGVDVVNAPDGQLAAVLARRKLAMRGGETDKAVSVADPGLVEFGRRLATSLGHIGCLDCDVVATEDGFVLLDANPRFGGGYPFVHEAGADLPRAFLAWAAGEAPDPDCFDYAPGVVGMKCDRLVTTR